MEARFPSLEQSCVPGKVNTAEHTDSEGNKDLHFQYQGISRTLLCRKGSMPNFVAMTRFSLLAKFLVTLIIVSRIF